MTTNFDNEQYPISEENEILHGDLMYTLDKIRFWVTIIGFYVLVKMIIIVIILVSGVISISNLLDIFNKLLN